jgi:hypothetical protein
MGHLVSKLGRRGRRLCGSSIREVADCDHDFPCVRNNFPFSYGEQADTFQDDKMFLRTGAMGPSSRGAFKPRKTNDL